MKQSTQEIFWWLLQNRNFTLPPGFKHPKIPKNSWEMDPEVWLCKFCKMLTSYCYDSGIIHLFHVLLEGLALRWLNSLKFSDLINYDNVIDLFWRRFINQIERMSELFALQDEVWNWRRFYDFYTCWHDLCAKSDLNMRTICEINNYELHPMIRGWQTRSTFIELSHQGPKEQKMVHGKI